MGAISGVITAFTTAAEVASGVSAAAEVFGGFENAQASQEQAKMLEAKNLQERQQAVEKKLKRDNEMEHIFSQQVSQASAQGIGLSSPSLKALSDDSFNQYDEERRYINMNEKISSDALTAKADSLRKSGWLDVAGGLIEAASDLEGTHIFGSEAPKLSKTKAIDEIGNSKSKTNDPFNLGDDYDAMSLFDVSGGS